MYEYKDTRGENQDDMTLEKSYKEIEIREFFRKHFKRNKKNKGILKDVDEFVRANVVYLNTTDEISPEAKKRLFFLVQKGYRLFENISSLRCCQI